MTLPHATDLRERLTDEVLHRADTAYIATLNTWVDTEESGRLPLHEWVELRRQKAAEAMRDVLVSALAPLVSPPGERTPPTCATCGQLIGREDVIASIEADWRALIKDDPIWAEVAPRPDTEATAPATAEEDAEDIADAVRAETEYHAGGIELTPYPIPTGSGSHSWPATPDTLHKPTLERAIEVVKELIKANETSRGPLSDYNLSDVLGHLEAMRPTDTGTARACATCRFFDFSERDMDGKGCCENDRVLSLFMCLGPYDFNVPPTFGCNYHEAKPTRTGESQ